jgi:copper transport protein
MRPLAAILLGIVIALAAPAAPAGAHAALVRTSPVQGSVVDQPPNEIVVTFSEAVTQVKDKIQVVGPDGRRVDQGQSRVTDRDLHIPVRTDVPRGTFLVSYRVISADNHPVGAGFSYSLGAPSQTPPQLNDAAAGGTDRAVEIAVGAARYLGYAGLVLIAGPTLVLIALWPLRLSRRMPTRLAYLGLGLTGLGALLELYFQAPYESGGGLFSASVDQLGAVLGGGFGTVHLIRLGVLVLAGFLLRPVLAGGDGSRRVPAGRDGLRLVLAGGDGTVIRAVLAVLAVIGVATWPLSGHPATSNAPTLTVIADAAHLVSMAVWLGGLVMLVGFLLRRANAKELDAILPVWSNWALLAVAVLVLAGTAQALIQVATVDALLHTGYGVLLLVKIGLLALVVAVATVARQVVRRRAAAAGDKPAGVRRLRRTVFVELAGAVLILGLTSALVQTTPGRNAAARPATTEDGQIFSTTLDSDLYQLQLDVEPVSVGNSEVHLYAYTKAGAPLLVKEWTVTAALPGRGIEPIDVPVLRRTDSHASGSVTLPAAGDWQFSFTLRTTDVDQATVRTVITIK